MKKIRAVLLSAGIITAAGALFLVIGAFVVSRLGALPRGSLSVLTTAICCLAVFLGSYLISQTLKEKGILLGLACGAVTAFCIALVSVFVFGNEFTLAGAGKAAALLLSGAIGGVLGVNRKSRVKF